MAGERLTVLIRRVTRIKRAVRKVLHAPIPIWNLAPKQMEQDRNFHFWVFIVLLVLGISIHEPIFILALLLLILCGGVIAFVLQKSHKNGQF